MSLRVDIDNFESGFLLNSLFYYDSVVDRTYEVEWVN